MEGRLSIPMDLGASVCAPKWSFLLGSELFQGGCVRSLFCDKFGKKGTWAPLGVRPSGIPSSLQIRTLNYIRKCYPWVFSCSYSSRLRIPEPLISFLFPSKHSFPLLVLMHAIGILVYCSTLYA